MIEVVYSWNQMKDEPDLWFGRFHKYARPLGTEYTVAKAFTLYRLDAMRTKTDTSAESAPVWSTIATQWSWEQRAKQWFEDDRLDTEIRWKARKLELLEEDWSLGSKLRKVVTRALEDIEEACEVDDGEVKLKIPLSHISQAARASSELQRLAADAPTVITKTLTPQVYLPQVEKVE
jgi:hypothetical protein